MMHYFVFYYVYFLLTIFSSQDSDLLLQGIAKSVDMLLAWYKCFPESEGIIYLYGSSCLLLQIL